MRKSLANLVVWCLALVLVVALSAQAQGWFDETEA